MSTPGAQPKLDGFAYEPCHEKTNVLHMRKHKDTDQLRGNREADQSLVFAT